MNEYFPPDVSSQGNAFKDYSGDIDIDSIPRISAFNLIKNIIQENKGGKDNIWILSDMDPGLQKAAQKHGIPAEHRVDQQNHAILLNENDVDSNVVLPNAVLAKVLDARGGMISHIALGGKNTLIDAHKTAVGLGIDAKTSLKERRNKINEVIFQSAKSLDNSELNTAGGYVLKGHQVSSPQDTDKVVYVYAHNKTSIIAKHVIKKLRDEDPAYSDKMYVFCGKNAIPGYNAMHLAYLTDADGITTAGAGTSGEFVWLHRHGGSEANLLILPIENHNEQEAIASCLHREFPENILRLNSGDSLESGKKIDDLVKRKRTVHSAENADSERLMNATGASGSYVQQTHDILFSHADISEEITNFMAIERKMYNNQDMKATRRYLKLYFQTTTTLSRSISPFPIEISFKMNAGPVIIFNDAQEIKALFNDNTKMKNLINMSSETALNKLPLFEEVKQLMTTSDFPLHANDIEKLDTKFGHRMTTGF